MATRKTNQGTRSRKTSASGTSPTANGKSARSGSRRGAQTAERPEMGQPGGGQGRTDVTGTMPEGIQVDRVALEGNLAVPQGAWGVVLFAHGSGSGRHSPRNRFVAGQLRAAGLATLLVDLLTEEEEVVDQRTAHLRFDIGLLADRLLGATDWLANDPRTAGLSVGYFG